ncbi:unnamed protein product [Alopecurus aequalis]
MTTTPTTSGVSCAQARWSDLPDDILGNIRLKIASLRERVRLAAVCKAWQAAAARLPAPAAAPLLLLSPRSEIGRVRHLCGSGPGDSWVMHVPDKAVDKYIMGSHKGGWVALLEYTTRNLTLLNLFSGVEVGVCSPRPDIPWGILWWSSVCHVIFSDDPASSRGCILATIADDLSSIALCKLGCRSGWTKHGWENKLFTNIAFCNGDLYGLVYPDKELVRFKISTKEDGSPMVTSTHQLAIQSHDVPTVAYYDCYIVELHGKPSKAIRTQWVLNQEPFFKVFELVDTDGGEAYQHKWVEMSSFGDYALFLGPARCKAVHVPVGAERRGCERNHIYYSKGVLSRESNWGDDEVYSLRLDDGRFTYCIEDQNIGDGLGRTGYYTMGSDNESMRQNASIWLDPPNL